MVFAFAPLAQAQAPSQLDGCVYNSGGLTATDGQRIGLQCNSTGALITSASVSASITPFAPTTSASLSVSNVSANVALPSGTTTNLCNTGATTAYYKFGASGVTAATTDNPIQGGLCIALAPGSNTYIAGITASGSTTFTVTGGAGLPTMAFGPASAVTSNLAQINGVTVVAGNGVTGTGSQRVTLASDGPTFAATAGGTAPATAQAIGGIYNLTPPTFTDGQFGALRIDADGTLYTNVRDPIAAGTNIIGRVGIDQTTPGTTNLVAAGQNGTWTVQPGNTANTTPWLVAHYAATAGGCTPVHYLSAATNNSTNVKASAGQLYNNVTVINTTATLYYLKLYDKATAPTCGTDTPVQTYPVPASTSGAGVVTPINVGMAFTTGIGFCLVAGLADNDNTSAATGVAINTCYK